MDRRVVNVALLRGINVGGKNKIPMERLREIGRKLGLGDVSTYINSGNLLFSSEPKSDLALSISTEIQQQFNIAVSVVVCTGDRLRAALENNPFPHSDPSRVLVYFCDADPAASAIADLDLSRSPQHELQVAGREVYLSAPDGLHKSKFSLDYLEKTLGVTMTSRNVNTVRKLCRVADHH